MKPFQLLREEIRKTLIEAHSKHRCMDGRLVDSESEDCYMDIKARIDDAMYHRDHCTGGTANRAYYNGVLADLRKRKRRLGKLYESREKQAGWTKAIPKDDWNQLAYADQSDLTGYNRKSKDRIKMTNSRRDLKRYWNENADRAWFESDEIKCVHWLGWLKGLKGGIEGLDRFLYYNLGNGLKKDELSAFGYVGEEPNMRGANMIGILLSPRRITFAAKTDAYTEELHRASSYQRKTHKDSGLPKRPSAVAPQHVIFDKEDLGGVNLINEIICDNWDFDTIYVGDYWLDPKERRLVEIYADAVGLNVLRFDGSESMVVPRKDDIERIEKKIPRVKIGDLKNRLKVK